jgi:signal peptidase I
MSEMDQYGRTSSAGSADAVENGESPSGDGTKTKQAKNEIWEWTKALLIALGLVFLIRQFLFAPFIVDGPSMQPNFHTGERLIVNKIIYAIRKPKRGEVIVFHATKDKDYIKRVIALPGETVKVQGDEVLVNGKPLDEPYIREAVEQAHRNNKPYNRIDMPEITVPEGTVFVMGDNRSDSTDSRSPMLGPIPYDRIVGRADLLFWPIGEFRLIH